MEDRFKFRVWDEERKRYSPFDDLFLSQDGEVYEEHSKCVNCIVEQCTGIRDRNGKLIYEGDFLKSYNGIIVQVKWKTGGYYIVWSKRNWVEFFFDGSHWEVVGNIHEVGK